MTKNGKKLKFDIDITDKNLQKVNELLRTLLADEVVLYFKTKNYHWNVTGMQFHALHLFLDTQADQIQEMIDEIAERMRALNSFSPGSLKEFLENTRLTEEASYGIETEHMLKNLLADHQTLVKYLRLAIDECSEKYKDTGTADLLTGWMESHEKMVWMLQAHLQ